LIKYCSTRDASVRKDGAQVILEGLAADGGLYVPVEIPPVSPDFISAMAHMDYADRASAVMALYLEDYTDEELTNITAEGYRHGRFDDARVAPVVSLDEGVHVLELFHGPTLAFKDMALQMLPRLLPLAMKKCGTTRDALILVATSGDTGKAALEGFRDVPGTKIVVFYPDGGVSRAQYIQMATQPGSNLSVVGVRGNFDDCQRGVKALFSSEDFERTINGYGCASSSANSINWGRLLPQIAYYFYSYADLLSEGKIASGAPVNFVVPTGNFGNILAGEYARMMGLPINTLICASNANNVLTDFFRTGKYDSRRAFYRTMSPSMDILVSSNLERLLFIRSGMDDEKVRFWMQALSGGGAYDVAELRQAMTQGYYAAQASEDETLRAIAQVFEKHNYLMDPHTAVGYHVYRQYLEGTGDETPTVLLSTASPYKFCDSVLRAVQGNAPKDAWEAVDKVAELSGISVPPALEALRNAPILHKTVCEPDEMGAAVIDFLKK
jgi:threonine synthase